jgi:hypothetical protein
MSTRSAVITGPTSRVRGVIDNSGCRGSDTTIPTHLLLDATPDAWARH